MNMSTDFKPTELPLVTVIIPTIGRPSLREAVESALAQTWGRMEVVVSVDGTRQLIDGLELPDDPRLRVIASGSRAGAQVARGRGISESRGEFIALLDDDDVWFPLKIEQQLEIAFERFSEGADHVVIGCRTEVVDDAGKRLRTTPRRLPDPNESLSEYIFVRHRLRPDTAIGSSIFLFHRPLTDQVPQSSDLTLHEDWDWLLSVQQKTDTEVQFSPEVLLRYKHNLPGTSASSSASWRTSQRWFVEHRGDLSARQFADGLLGYTAPLAIQERDWQGVRVLLRRSMTNGRPGLPALLFVSLLSIKHCLLPN